MRRIRYGMACTAVFGALASLSGAALAHQDYRGDFHPNVRVADGRFVVEFSGDDGGAYRMIVDRSGSIVRRRAATKRLVRPVRDMPLAQRAVAFEPSPGELYFAHWDPFVRHCPAEAQAFGWRVPLAEPWTTHDVARVRDGKLEWSAALPFGVPIARVHRIFVSAAHFVLVVTESEKKCSFGDGVPSSGAIALHWFDRDARSRVHREVIEHVSSLVSSPDVLIAYHAPDTRTGRATIRLVHRTLSAQP